VTVARWASWPSTSPFSGGALLGDRIRMIDLAGDQGVFIRSMASRGSLGGLAAATGDVVRVLDAAGFDYVLVETVGAGQSEVDIVRTAHTTVVVDAPGLGDDVQAIKAGILEIADILVVNKADRPGADNTVRALQTMLELGHRFRPSGHHGPLVPPPDMIPDRDYDFWQVPILKTVAIENEGLDALVDAITRHGAHLKESGIIEEWERVRVEAELADRLRGALLARLLETVPAETFDALLDQLVARTLDPDGAVRALLDGDPAR
jgi:LAO/AO transport system kinase